jgi:hypothetical protein
MSKGLLPTADVSCQDLDKSANVTYERSTDFTSIPDISGFDCEIRIPNAICSIIF